LIRKKTLEEVLRLGDRYGVAEIWLTEGSDLLGLTLAEAGLTERGILVLAIEREGQFVHMPRSYDRIEEGVTLLVYGDLKSLHQLTENRRGSE
jgi:Trk K+ transport system NAD-binding subunit